MFIICCKIIQIIWIVFFDILKMSLSWKLNVQVICIKHSFKTFVKKGLHRAWPDLLSWNHNSSLWPNALLLHQCLYSLKYLSQRCIQDSPLKFLHITATWYKPEVFHYHAFFNVAFWLQALFHSKKECILDKSN